MGKGNNIYFYIALILVLFLSLALGGYAAGVFRKETACPFSSIKGVITYQGAPAASAKIVRKVESAKKTMDYTFANEAGAFRFPAMYQTYWRILPSQWTAYQEMYVHFKHKKYHIWYLGKVNPDEDGERGGRRMEVRCELTDELEPVNVPEALLMTSCKWN